MHHASVAMRIRAGFPVDSVPVSRASDTTLHDLAGNAFSGTVVLAIMLSVAVHAPELTYSKTHASSDSCSEVDDILSTLCADA